MIAEGPRQRFFLQASQSFRDCSVEYRVVISEEFMEKLPQLRDFDGWFNVNNLELIDRNWDFLEHPSEWIQLNPEALSMQLLRLAYIAAMHEEGPFGDVPSPPP